ncbi:MAG: alpha/beta hydrolase [Pseudobutyrivibrio sp.]|nr:alpha/beta hydrolase [Pseudobutyrivibrio sp.]
MLVEGKHIYIYGKENTKAPLVIVNTFQGDGYEIYEAIQQIESIPIVLAVISDIDWNDEMTPWECPPMFKGDSPCIGGADDYIRKLEDKIVPAILAELNGQPSFVAIAGYSLGGLFAIYSLYKTDIFSRAVSASGSMWFPGFLDFVRKNEMLVKPDRVYFSLGDKEAKTRNQMLCTVEASTKEICELIKNNGIESIFEMNEGNHFKDADLRLAKGIKWICEN